MPKSEALGAKLGDDDEAAEDKNEIDDDEDEEGEDEAQADSAFEEVKL